MFNAIQARVLAVCLLGALVPACAPQTTAPAPSGPVAALSFYVGAWSENGTSRADPAADFSPLEGHETCDWIENNTAVVCHESVTDVSGTSDALYILGYDEANARYFVQGTDYAADGIIRATGTVENGIWSWDAVMAMAGTQTPMRFVFGPAEGGRTLVVSVDGGGGEMFEAQRVSYQRLD